MSFPEKSLSFPEKSLRFFWKSLSTLCLRINTMNHLVLFICKLCLLRNNITNHLVQLNFINQKYYKESWNLPKNQYLFIFLSFFIFFPWVFNIFSWVFSIFSWVFYLAERNGKPDLKWKGQFWSRKITHFYLKTKFNYFIKIIPKTFSP